MKREGYFEAYLTESGKLELLGRVPAQNW